MTWNDNSSFVSAMYYRIYYQITLANEFLRYTETQWMDDHSFSDQEKTMILISEPLELLIFYVTVPRLVHSLLPNSGFVK